jgi:hypothetical protein
MMLVGIEPAAVDQAQRVSGPRSTSGNALEAGADVAVRSFIRCGHDMADGTIAAVAAEDDIAAASGISRPTGQRARDRIADDGHGVDP